MLKQWQWALQGKHPMVNDYIYLGEEFPLMKVFSDWIKGGYQIVASKKGDKILSNSWRFWTRGTEKDNLVCGLLRDSSDGVGRPYPLLLLGTGPLKNWHKGWDLLTFACEKTWSQMEYISTRMWKNLQTLEEEIAHLKPPVPQWTDFLKEKKQLLETRLTYSRDQKNILSKVTELSERQEIFLCLDRQMEEDTFSQMLLWHFSFKDRCKDIPKIIFMGGTAEKLFLVILNRPLSSGDFTRLWQSHRK